MKPSIYKSIMLPAELQEKIKLLATKKKKTIIEFITELINKS
jgi:predicted DNA-binding protein